MIHVSETTDGNLLASLNQEIQNLHHRLYPTIFKPYNKSDIEYTLNQLLKEPNVKAFIVSQEEIVGYALITTKSIKENPFRYEDRVLYIDQILILDKAKRTGCGRALLEKIYSEAKSIGIKRIELDHWTLNDSARFFFKASNFQYFNEKMFTILEV